MHREREDLCQVTIKNTQKYEITDHQVHFINEQYETKSRLMIMTKMI
jgi:hypothetical protein